MKRIASIAALLAATAAFAAVSLTTENRNWQMVRGTTNVGSAHATEAACMAAVRADAEARKTSGNYRCVNALAVRAEWTADPVTPPVVTPPVVTPTDPHNGGVQAGNMPRYNPATIPRPAAGSSTLDLYQTSQQPTRDHDSIGAFRTVCTPSHFNRDDSLIFPGQVGRAHLHMYFGNTGSNANSTPESIRTTGNSTCRGGIANRSTYWVPAMIDTADGAVMNMDRADVYYKTGYSGLRNEQIQSIPPGLRMIAGDMMATQKLGGFWGNFDFRCGGQRDTAIPNGCTSGELSVELLFPQCWDGRNLTSPDHKSHMAYGTGSGCPASHPVALPVITYVVHFPIPAGRNTSTWRLSSDNYVGGQGGASMHGDWINGWSPDLPPLWTSLIINRGLSNSSVLVGDGRAMR